MGYDLRAARRPVNLNINADLIEQCRSGVGNLSAHVEALLAADLANREAKADLERRKTEQAIDVFCAFYDEHGSLSEELEGL